MPLVGTESGFGRSKGSQVTGSRVATLDVGRDFSMTPGGRFRRDGEHSGEDFRVRLVEPLLDAGNDVIIDLDSPVGFTSSFLEEVFGGLVRRYSPAIQDRVTPRAARRPTREKKARMYMARAIAAYASK
jgi:STAS-like domain of unknown function (DUF4325)